MFIDKLASVFVFSVPFILAIAGYYWLMRKIVRLNNQLWKVIAFILWLCGCGYSVFVFVQSVHEILEPMNFNLVVIAINCFLMLVVSVAIALGKPENEPQTNSKQETVNR